MAFIELGAPKRGGSRVGPRSHLSNLTVVKGGRNGDDLSVQITISAEVMMQMRWLTGDGVALAFDDKDPLMVLVKRVQKGGRTISSPGGIADYGKSGKRGMVKFTLPEHLPLQWQDRFYCESPTEAHGGLVFSFKAAD